MAFRSIPTYSVSSNSWTYTNFELRADFVSYLWTLFKEPGEYEFDESVAHFNRQARVFAHQGYFCDAPNKTKDFIKYWDAEKEKCRLGVIIQNGDKQWYLPRDYYMWVNFLPIYHKEKKKFLVPEIRDVQYHIALYEEIAECVFKHCAILKKRQIASSYFHAAKMINRFWFEEGFMNKMAGTLKSYINAEGTWRFLEEYRNFLNEHTAWIRPCTPDKVLNWQQQIEMKINGVKIMKGLKSVIIGLVLDKDVTNGVGGPCGLFFHEEAGIAPKMNKTLEFLLPALKSGLEYTGMFVVAGSVGELDQCEPLRDLMFNPASKDVLAIKTNLLDSKGSVGECALFIPEQWSMPPYIDQFGNSIIHEPKPEQLEQLRKNWVASGKDLVDFDPTVGALSAILTDRAIAKKAKSAADYQLYVSQHPINIEEAFAARTKSIFPLHLVGAQVDRIKAKEYFLKYKDIVRGAKTGKPEWKDTKRLPIDKFPFNAAAQDKEGAIVVHEDYIEGSSFGTYVASIDPVRDGKSTTSDSLCSIYIYKNDVEVMKRQADGTVKMSLEPGKLVAWWCGRFNDINDTHERCELLLEMYNAKSIVENNVTGFITHMIQRHKQKYLIRADELLFLKEMGANQSVYQDYGWRNTGLTFKLKMLPYAASVMSEELDRSVDEEGNTLVTKFGIERFADIMLFEEVKAYREGLNVDRLISFAALMSYVKIQRANRAGEFVRREETEAKKLQLKATAPILKERSAFRHIGQSTFDPVTLTRQPTQRPRSPFRNIK